MLTRISIVVAVVGSFVIGVNGAASGGRQAGALTLSSADGGAIVRRGGPVPALPAIDVVRLPDDDPAAVVGTHYRVDGHGQSWPSGTTLSIRWTASGVPGGATADSLTISRLGSRGWASLAGVVSTAAQGITTPLPGDGEFAIRWRASGACTGETARALDFRLGVWDYRASGYDPGRTTVTADASGCALFEDYVDVKGGRSRSFFVVGADGRWHVTTYDPGGRSVMAGTVEPAGVAFYHSLVDREAYRRTASGATFSGERSADGGRTWTAWVTAAYTKVK